MKTINMMFAIIASVVALMGCNEKTPAAAAAPAVAETPRAAPAVVETVIAQDRPMPTPRAKKPGNF